MNYLPSDLKNEVYLHLPLDQFLTFIDNPSKNLWINKANISTGKNVKDQFLKIEGDNKDRYILTLALNNVFVPGSEQFVCEAQIMKYARDHGNKELAKYIISKIQGFDGIKGEDIGETLSNSSWIDLIKLAWEKKLISESELQWDQIAYHNPGPQVNHLHQLVGEQFKIFGATFNDNINLYLATMLGSDISEQVKSLGMGHQNTVTYLARIYGHDKLADHLLEVFTDPSNEIWQFYAWIRRGNLEKVKELFDPHIVEMHILAEKVTKVDNLPIFNFILNQLTGVNQNNYMHNCLRDSIYGSQIFSQIVAMPNMINYLTSEMLEYKTYFDFAGIYYLLEKSSTEKRRELFEIVDTHLELGEADVHDKTYNYLKAKFGSIYSL